MKVNQIILNLIAVFVVAFAFTTFLHELAHAITAKMLGVDSVLFHSYVSYDNTTTPENHQLLIVSSGPLISLLQSLVFLMLVRRAAKIDLVALLYLWLGIVGMVVFLGYIMMGPFMPYGDTGKIYAILSVPDYIALSLSALALIVIIFFFRKLKPFFVDFMLQIKAETGFENKKTIWLFFVLPIFVGTLINVLISLPAPTLMSLAFPMVIPLTMIPSTIRLLKSNWLDEKQASNETIFSKGAYWAIIAMIVMVVISRILAVGINI